MMDTDSFVWLLESGVKLLIHIKEAQFKELVSMVDSLRPELGSISHNKMHVYPAP